MATIATANINIVPKFDGFKEAVEKAVNEINPEAQGQQVGSSFGGGMMKTGAIAGAFAAITNKAMDSISSHVGSAIQRFDTLNNYPKVMQTLGYTADEVDSSLAMMDSRLSSLPTTLNSMVSTVQGLVTITGDLGQATQAGLAMNDMLVASGAGTQQIASAMEQFRQILAKGKPEMQDWKTLTQTMPGQMDQLAKSLLGTSASASDLYAALGGGGADAIISMDELLNEIIRLDTQGGESFASFKDQAETAAGGLQTAMDNFSNAWTRGIAGIFDEIGADTISGVFNDLKQGVNDAFGVARSVIAEVLPVAKSFYEVIKEMAPALITMGTSMAVLTKVNNSKFFESARVGIAGYVKEMGEASKQTTLFGKAQAGLKGGLSSLAGMFNPVSLAITGISLAIGAGVQAYTSYKEATENAHKASQGLKDAVSATGSLQSYHGIISSIGETSSNTSISIKTLNESIAAHVDKMNESASAAQAEIGELNTAKQIIEESIGATDLSTQAQGRLEWAIKLLNEQFGLSIEASDVMAGKYTDQEDVVHDLKQSVDELIDSKKQEILMDLYSDQYVEAMEAQQTATKAYVDYYNEHYLPALEASKNGELYGDVRLAEAENQLAGFKEKVEETGQAVSDIEALMADTVTVTQDTSNAFVEWGKNMDSMTGGIFSTFLSDNGGISGLAEDLEALGLSAEDLASFEWNDENLAELASSYEGTTDSIAQYLQSLGFEIDEANLKSAEYAEQASEFLAGVSDKTKAALEDLGINVETFSGKLAEAGASTEILNELGSENIATLAENFNGDLDLMAWAIANFNTVDINPKTGEISIDESQLIDAQGNIYKWNGQSLVTIDGQAAANDIQVQDALGRFHEWNGSSLKVIEGKAKVTDNITEVLNRIRNYNNSELKDKSATVTITTNNVQVSTTTGNAKGGIRPHADGGITTMSSPVIARSAVPLDIVGEAGAEAIVPLTNKQYSQPFIDLLAQGINEQNNVIEAINMLIGWLENRLSEIIAHSVPDNLKVNDRTFASLVRRYV